MSNNPKAKKFAMTRSTGRLATAKLATAGLAALSFALTILATDASAQLFGRRSDEATAPTQAAPANRAPTNKAPANNATESTPGDLESALVKAQLSRRMGDLAEATRILSQLVLFAPDDSRVMGEYGKTFAAQGRSDDAIAFLERAIQIQPNEWSYHSAMGVAYDQKGNYPLAQAAYGRALALRPGEPSALNNAALSYLQSGDIETAERMVHEAQAVSTPADKPRIEQTVALVERLKGSRPAAAARRVPERVSPPESAPARLASAAPPPPAPDYNAFSAPSTDQGDPVVTNPPVDSNWLPPPEFSDVEMSVNVTPPAEAPASARALAELQSDPTVIVQAVPKDANAGPVRRPEPKKAPATAQKPAPAAPTRRQLAVSAQPPLTARAAQAAPAPKAQVVHAYYVQAGAFATEERADKMAQSLDSMGARVSPTTVGGKSLYRVRIGPFKDAQQANDALGVAKSMGHTDVRVVTE